MQDYDITIVFRPGKVNGNADGLSRKNYEDEINEDLSVHVVEQPCQRNQGLAGGPVGPGRSRVKDKKRRKKEEKPEENCES